MHQSPILGWIPVDPLGLHLTRRGYTATTVRTAPVCGYFVNMAYLETWY